MAAKKIFNDEELVDLFCQYLVLSFRNHTSTGAGLSTKERTSLINELVEHTGKSCTNAFKTKITMLGERVFEYILSEPNLKIQFYDSLIQKEPDNLEFVLKEFQLFVFRGLKEEGLIEGNSNSFIGSEDDYSNIPYQTQKKGQKSCPTKSLQSSQFIASQSRKKNAIIYIVLK